MAELMCGQNADDVLRVSLGIAFLLLLCCGCGSGLEEFPTASTSGTVTCNGNPVANVRVYFSPKSSGSSAIAGKSGWGTTDEDGAFVISTYGEEDGAVVGSHNVSVDSPHPERFPDFRCECATNPNQMIMTVDVAANEENMFTIELPSKKGRRQPSIDPEDLDDIREKE